MSSVIITLADAVVSDLNDETFSQSFTAVRKYVPKFDLADSADLQVQVVPRMDTRTAAARGYTGHEIVLDVGIFQRVTGTATEEATAADSLMDFAEEVKDYLTRYRPTDYDAAICNSVTNDPIYSVEEMEGKRVFLAVVSPTFLCNRAV